MPSEVPDNKGLGKDELAQAVKNYFLQLTPKEFEKSKKFFENYIHGNGRVNLVSPIGDVHFANENKLRAEYKNTPIVKMLDNVVEDKIGSTMNAIQQGMVARMNKPDNSGAMSFMYNKSKEVALILTEKQKPTTLVVQPEKEKKPRLK